MIEFAVHLLLLWVVVSVVTIIGIAISKRLISPRDLSRDIKRVVYEVLYSNLDPLARRHAATLLRSKDIQFDEQIVLECLYNENDLWVKLTLVETLLIRSSGRLRSEMVRLLEEEERKTQSQDEKDQINALRTRAIAVSA